MTKQILTLAAFALIALAPAVKAQGVQVNADLAKKGKSLFSNRGCNACHQFGKKAAGPDLVGANDRRSQEWMKNWLKNPDQMLQTDSTAKAMLAEYQNVKMPNMKLTDAEVEALIHYMQEETNKKKK